MSSVTKSDISSLIEQLRDLVTKRDISNLIEKLPEESHPCESYKEPIKAMLAIATFAGAITFSIILTPRGSPTHAIKELAYANSLFFVVIMGCVLIIVSIEVTADLVALEKKVKVAKDTVLDIEKGKEFTWESLKNISPQHKSGRLSSIEITIAKHFGWFRPFIGGFFIPFGVGIIGAMQFTAFYLMLHASLLFLQYNGPFILGTVLYVTIGVLTFIMWFFRSFVKSGVRSGEILVSDMRERRERKMENAEKKMEHAGTKMEELAKEMEHTGSKMDNTEIKMEELAKEMMKLAKELVEAGAIIKRSTKEREGSAG
jgi:hypothetical protein